MHLIGKQTRRTIKRVTLGWRYGLADRATPFMRRNFGTLASYLDMLLIDHGIFRLIYLNRHRIDAHAWRAAQPAPHQIAALPKLGIRTVVNLRGERMCGSYYLERAACERHGLKFVDFQVRSRAAPSLAELRGARELLETVEYPILMHCKSGADRAGLMSVLYRHLREGVPIAEALPQLSLRFGHIRQGDTGILDAFFERYLSDTANRPMPFFQWVETVYDPEDVKKSFVANGWAQPPRQFGPSPRVAMCTNSLFT